MTYFFSRHALGALAPVLLFSLPHLAHAGVLSAIAGLFSHAEAARMHSALPLSAQTVPLLRAAIHIDPNPSKGGGSVLVESGALVPQDGPAGVGGEFFLPQNGEISVYVVREGDSLSQIAEMFGVSANTILWANDIKKANLIKPGDSLVILPVSGVRHTVKKGDTVASIAKAYAGDVADIIAYNGLSSVEDIAVGESIVVPGGRLAAPAKKKAPAPSRGGAGVGGGVATGGYFTNPVPGSARTQGVHGYNGIDLGAGVGTSVRAAAAGEVLVSRASGWNGGYGNYIVIKHGNGTQTLYAHLSATYAVAGQSVARGEEIGAVGATGQATGPHLHFEVRGGTNPF